MGSPLSDNLAEAHSEQFIGYDTNDSQPSLFSVFPQDDENIPHFPHEYKLNPPLPYAGDSERWNRDCCEEDRQRLAGDA